MVCIPFFFACVHQCVCSRMRALIPLPILSPPSSSSSSSSLSCVSANAEQLDAQVVRPLLLFQVLDFITNSVGGGSKCVCACVCVLWCWWGSPLDICGLIWTGGWDTSPRRVPPRRSKASPRDRRRGVCRFEIIFFKSFFKKCFILWGKKGVIRAINGARKHSPEKSTSTDDFVG